MSPFWKEVVNIFANLESNEVEEDLQMELR